MLVSQRKSIKKRNKTKQNKTNKPTNENKTKLEELELLSLRQRFW